MRAVVIRMAPFLVALLFAFPARSAPALERAWIARSAPTRIMTLGDSITAGVGIDGRDTGSGGYRAELVRLLARDGYHFEMVGGRSDYSGMLEQRHHEGWPGYVVRSMPSDPAPQLFGRLTRDAVTAADPDVILLMAGTNDLLRMMRHSEGYTLENIIFSMNELLAEIFTLKPNVTVIVAGVVASPRIAAADVARFDGTTGAGDAGGPSVRDLVAMYAHHGFRIAYAQEMADAVPRDTAHFPDGIHPCGGGGYALVARAWMDALEGVTARTTGAVATR